MFYPRTRRWAKRRWILKIGFKRFLLCHFKKRSQIVPVSSLVSRIYDQNTYKTILDIL